MSESTTIARPYAKAIFEHALAEDKLAIWSEYLLNLSQAILDQDAFEFITNPASKAEQQIDLLQSVCGFKAKENECLHNVIALLAANKRLLLLPDIQGLYEVHRAEQEKTLNVDVISFSALTPDQEQKMTDSLSKRIKRKVLLRIIIDPSLLGGAVIRAGDLVIDGSVRGKLNKLRTDLAV